MQTTYTNQFVICIDNAGYEVSLEKRKIYVLLPDAAAETHGQFRIIDESGDDYLYANDMFRLIALPHDVEKAILSAA